MQGLFTSEAVRAALVPMPFAWWVNGGGVATSLEPIHDAAISLAPLARRAIRRSTASIAPADVAELNVGRCRFPLQIGSRAAN